MSVVLAAGRPVRIVIRRVGITAASSIEARRLGDAIGPALDRAFTRLGDDARPQAAHRQRTADYVAEQIVAAVRARLEETS